MTDPRYEALRIAMRKIAWPMLTLREFAEDQGHYFNADKAREIAYSPGYLQSIAANAMAEITMIDPTGVNDRPQAPAVVGKIGAVNGRINRFLNIPIR